MTLRRLTLLFFLFVFFSISHSNAGGWPQPKGGGYFKLAEWWVVSDQHFDGDGNVQPNFVEYGYYSTSLYAEYGLSQKLTGIIYFPFLNYAYSVLPSSLIRQSIWKTGDADIGLKYALTFEKPIAISASMILGLPLGYNENGALLTGDGEFNQIVRIDAGLGFKLFKSNAWLSFHAGYNHRAHEYADELQYGAEGGINISKDKLSVVARIAGIDALGNPDNAPFVNPQSLFSNYAAYLSFSPEIAYHINPAWGVTIGAGTALSGKNIFANPTFTLGVFYKKKPKS